MAPMRCLNDLRTTKLKNVKFQKTLGWATIKKVCFTSEKAMKMRNRLPITKKEITDQRTTFQNKLQIPQPKAISDISNFLKSMKTVDLKTIQTSSRGKKK